MLERKQGEERSSSLHVTCLESALLPGMGARPGWKVTHLPQSGLAALTGVPGAWPGLQLWPGQGAPWLPTPGKADLCSTAGRSSPAAAAKPGCLARAALPEGCQAARRSWQRGARGTRGQRRWKAITSPLRPALIPSHGAQGAGSPNKAQSG